MCSSELESADCRRHTFSACHVTSCREHVLLFFLKFLATNAHTSNPGSLRLARIELELDIRNLRESSYSLLVLLVCFSKEATNLRVPGTARPHSPVHPISPCQSPL